MATYHTGSNNSMVRSPLTPLSWYSKVFETTVGILTKGKVMARVEVPPLPRYLFAGCCTQVDHSTNVSEPGFAKSLLTEVIGLRNGLKKFVSGLGVPACCVLDSLCITDCPVTANMETKLEAL